MKLARIAGGIVLVSIAVGWTLSNNTTLGAPSLDLGGLRWWAALIVLAVLLVPALVIALLIRSSDGAWPWED